MDEYLVSAGVNIRLSNNACEMHDKLAIIDRHIVITGSFNWTETANTSNDENLLIIDPQALGAVYEPEFQAVWSAASERRAPVDVRNGCNYCT